MKKVIIVLIVCIVIGCLTGLIFYFVDDFSDKRKTKLLDIVEKYYNQGEISTAEGLLINFIAEDPEETDTLVMLDTILEEKREREKLALEELEYEKEIAELLKKYLYQLYSIKKSVDALKTDNLKSADNSSIKKDDDKILMEPAALEISQYIVNGQNAYKKGQYTKAVDFFTKAVIGDSNNAAAHALLGASLFEENPQDTDNLNKAIDHSEKAVALDTGNKTGYLTLGKVYECQGNKELAIYYYLKSLYLDPDDTDLTYKLGRLYYGTGKNVLASEYLNKVIEKRKDIPQAFYYLACIEREKQNMDKAALLFEQAIACNEKYYNAYIQLAECYLHNGYYQKAVQNYKKSLEIKKDFFVICRTADCYMVLGSQKEAEKVYLKAINQFELNSPEMKVEGALVYEKLADLSFDSGNYDKAEEYATTGLELDPRCVNLYLLLSRINTHRDNYEDGIALLNNALRIDETNIEVHLELLRTYYKAGMKKNAKKTLKNFLDNNPDLEKMGDIKEIKGMINGM